MTGWIGGEKIDFMKADLLARGVYCASIVKAEPQPTKDGKPSVSLQLQVDQQFNGAPNEFNRRVYDRITLTKEAAFRVKQFCAALAVDPPASTSFEDVEAFCNDLVSAASKGVWVILKEDTYNGNTSNKVERYLKPSQAEVEAAKIAGNGHSGASASPF